MAQLTVITVGNLKEDYLRQGVDEYKKRLNQYAKTEEIELKEERIINEDDPAEIARALDREADKIIAKIPKDSFTAALCIEGKQYSSEELSAKIKSAIDTKGRLTLIIGSSHGLSDKVKSICDLRLSFSRLTFPHQLMKLVLFEALYRSFTIIAGKKYHK